MNIKIDHIHNSNPTPKNNVLIYTTQKDDPIYMPYDGIAKTVDSDYVTFVHLSDSKKCKFSTTIDNVDCNVTKNFSYDKGKPICKAKGNEIRVKISEGGINNVNPIPYINGTKTCDDTKETKKEKENTTVSRSDLGYDPFKVAAFPFLAFTGVGKFKNLLKTNYENHKEIVEEVERIKQLLK